MGPRRLWVKAVLEHRKRAAMWKSTGRDVSAHYGWEAQWPKAIDNRPNTASFSLAGVEELGRCYLYCDVRSL
jgi:hypothetical protein